MIAGLAPVVAGHDVLGSLAMVGRRHDFAGLACFEWRSCGSSAVQFGGSTVMRVWAQIFNSGRLSTVITGEFLARRVSAWTPVAASIFFFFLASFANGSCRMRILNTKSKK